MDGKERARSGSGGEREFHVRLAHAVIGRAGDHLAFILGVRYPAKPSDAMVTKPATASAFMGLPEPQDREQIQSPAMPGVRTESFTS